MKTLKFEATVSLYEILPFQLEMYRRLRIEPPEMVCKDVSKLLGDLRWKLSDLSFKNRKISARMRCSPFEDRQAPVVTATPPGEKWTN